MKVIKGILSIGDSPNGWDLLFTVFTGQNIPLDLFRCLSFDPRLTVKTPRRDILHRFLYCWGSNKGVSAKYLLLDFSPFRRKLSKECSQEL